MKCQLLYLILLIILISNSIELLKRPVKVESKTENQVSKGDIEIKSSVNDSYKNNTKSNEGKIIDQKKTKV